MSPLDWALIEAWQERKVPLHVVIRSIESVFDVFDKQPEGTRTIKSLFYCREEVEVQHREWLRSRAGKPEEELAEADAEAIFDAVAEHITNAVSELGNVSADNLSEDVARAIARLEELLMNLPADAETIDKTLGDIEKMLDRAMLENWDKTNLKAIEKEVAVPLKGYKSEMDAEAYKKTFELMLLKRLREDAGIPRLGLFYL